jgi:hypothetical protein
LVKKGMIVLNYLQYFISFLCLLKGIWNTKVGIKILNEMMIKRKIEKSRFGVPIKCFNISCSKSIPQLAKLKYQLKYYSRSYGHCKTFERYQVALSCCYNERKKTREIKTFIVEFK